MRVQLNMHTAERMPLNDLEWNHFYIKTLSLSFPSQLHDCMYVIVCSIVCMWRVLWSDESYRKTRVWRMAKELFSPKCCIGTVKHDTKIIVWGCFAAHGVGRLFKIDGITRKEQYLLILDNEMRPSRDVLFPQGGCVFQQDNDPKHTAIIIREWFDDNGVEKMVWPSQSSDLNPIENLWSYMDTSGLTWTGGFENARAIMLMRCFKSCKARWMS